MGLHKRGRSDEMLDSFFDKITDGLTRARKFFQRNPVLKYSLASVGVVLGIGCMIALAVATGGATMVPTLVIGLKAAALAMHMSYGAMICAGYAVGGVVGGCASAVCVKGVVDRNHGPAAPAKAAAPAVVGTLSRRHSAGNIGTVQQSGASLNNRTVSDVSTNDGQGWWARLFGRTQRSRQQDILKHKPANPSDQQSAAVQRRHSI